jgi:hypothetical protein
MRGINIPLGLFIIFIIVAWLGVLYIYWFKPTILPRVEAYFVNRRRVRRIRKYAEQDIMLTKMLFNIQQSQKMDGKLYDVNTIRKPEVYRATARHRR